MPTKLRTIDLRVLEKLQKIQQYKPLVLFNELFCCLYPPEERTKDAQRKLQTILRRLMYSGYIEAMALSWAQLDPSDPHQACPKHVSWYKGGGIGMVRITAKGRKALHNAENSHVAALS